MSGRYDDIIDMKHHVSSQRKPMSMYERAAQFSSFAALTGHEESIAETARITDMRQDADADALVILNRKLRDLIARAADNVAFTIVFFEPDKKKQGGSYVSVCDTIRKVDEDNRSLILSDGRVIPFSAIVDIN